MNNEPLTVEDGNLIKSQLTAALAIVTGIRKYLEPAGKLQPAEIRRFKSAEAALHAIRVKPITSRASEVAQRINQAQQGKFK